MKEAAQPTSATLAAAIASLVAAILLLDYYVLSDDVSISFLYTIPIFTAILSRRISPYLIAVVTTALSILGSFIHTPREALDIVFFTNRIISIVAQWLVAFVVASRITQETKLRGEMEVQRKKVETSRRFIDILSHEIGTSLTMIDGQAYRMRRLEELREPLELPERTAKIQAAVRHIEAVVRRVQLTSEIEEGGVTPALEKVSIASLIEDVVRDLEGDRKVTVEISPDVADIDADPGMIRQVLENLLSNALKYSADTPVRVAGAPADDAIRIEVTDFGRGIPPDETGRLTEPYFRASNSHGIHGTGIGLYVANCYVTAHGGRLDIDSTLGEKTTVAIVLPVRSKPGSES